VKLAVLPENDIVFFEQAAKVLRGGMSLLLLEGKLRTGLRGPTKFRNFSGIKSASHWAFL